MKINNKIYMCIIEILLYMFVFNNMYADTSNVKDVK